MIIILQIELLPCYIEIYHNNWEVQLIWYNHCSSVVIVGILYLCSINGWAPAMQHAVRCSNREVLYVVYLQN